MAFHRSLFQRHISGMIERRPWLLLVRGGLFDGHSNSTRFKWTLHECSILWDVWAGDVAAFVCMNLSRPQHGIPMD